MKVTKAKFDKGTLTQRYNWVITDIALKRKGIKAESLDQLTKANWDILIANAHGDVQFANLAVCGYFDQVGSEYLEEEGF